MAYGPVNPATGLKLTKDQAGTLVWWPPPESGRPTLPDITIKRPGDVDLPSTAVVAQAMTIDPFDGTLSVAATAGARELTVTDIADAKALRTVVIASKGRRESHVVLSVDSVGNKVVLADEVRWDHAIGATIQGVRLSYDLTALQLAFADRNVWAKVKWTDADSVVRHSSFMFHVVHREWELPTREEDVLRSWPDTLVHAFLRRLDMGFLDLMAEASDQLVTEFLRPAGYFEDQFFDQSPFVPLHVAICRRNLVLAAYEHDPERMVDIVEAWDGRIEKLWEALSARLPAYDSDNDGIVDAETEEGIDERDGSFLPRSASTRNTHGLDRDALDPRIRKIGGREARTEW